MNSKPTQTICIVLHNCVSVKLFWASVKTLPTFVKRVRRTPAILDDNTWLLVFLSLSKVSCLSLGWDNGTCNWQEVPLRISRKQIDPTSRACQRIMALIVVLTVWLLIYSLAEIRIHSAPSKKDRHVWDQKNKPTHHLTIRQVFTILEDVVVLYIRNAPCIEKRAMTICDEHRPRMPWSGVRQNVLPANPSYICGIRRCCGRTLQGVVIPLSADLASSHLSFRKRDQIVIRAFGYPGVV